MIRSNVIRVFALVVGAAAIYGGSQAQAATRRSETVTIPFDFRVANKTLPAGDYRVEQQFGTEIASLVNVKTRRSVQVLRPATSRVDGSAEFVFVQNGNNYHLRVR